MKILVCISHVPDTTTKIQFDESGTSLNRAGVSFVINPYDEYGLAKALDIKEAGQQAQITVISVGGPEVEPTLRKALAIGADDAVRVDITATDSWVAAREVAEYARERDFDIIFTGKESIDFNGGMTPGMIAEMLSYPFVSFATHMELIDEGASFKREIDGGVEVVETGLPVVVSCQKGISEWRIPNMRGIMAARKKPLSKVSGVGATPKSETTGFAYPPAKGETVYVDAAQAEKLVDLLLEKGLI